MELGDDMEMNVESGFNLEALNWLPFTLLDYGFPPTQRGHSPTLSSPSLYPASSLYRSPTSIQPTQISTPESPHH